MLRQGGGRGTAVSAAAADRAAAGGEVIVDDGGGPENEKWKARNERQNGSPFDFFRRNQRELKLRTYFAEYVTKNAYSVK